MEENIQKRHCTILWHRNAGRIIFGLPSKLVRKPFHFFPQCTQSTQGTLSYLPFGIRDMTRKEGASIHFLTAAGSLVIWITKKSYVWRKSCKPSTHSSTIMVTCSVVSIFFWIHLHEMDYEILFLHLKVHWDNCDNATSFPA